MRKTTLWSISLAILAVLMAVGFAVYKAVSSVHIAAANPNSVSTPSSQPASVDPGAPIKDIPAPNFLLTNQFGQPFSMQSFRGKVVVMGFVNSAGNTVSPLMAVIMRNVQYDLGSHKNQVAFVAINANPVTTSTQDVYQFSKANHMLHNWQFLTGTPSELTSVWHHYFMQTQIIHGSLISHTPGVFVIGPHGHEHWVYLNSPSTSTKAIGAQVHNILEHVVPLLPGHPALTIPPARELAYYPTTIGPSESVNRSFTLPAIMPGGKSGSVSVGSGGPIRLLDFFATWCPDCQEEMPTLAHLERWDKSHPQYPQVVAIDLRLSESSTAHVVAYANRLHLPFPVALDNHGKISDLYGVSGIPTQVLVSSSGRILWYHEGLISWNALIQDIRAHLPATKSAS
ncbi:TlpA family protein disulfide reductase [Sulfobacillus thermosulfidooxidans]|uniref:TlpA family protein disulfide reductase n=1 Tax=Sulfobacillus thermosulfidooxidans TaxID=28034 RepID=UPI0002DEFF09|nr:TlpA family protein disulfide reductase [Sulfobacillus thermosulfidooxidans]